MRERPLKRWQRIMIYQPELGTLFAAATALAALIFCFAIPDRVQLQVPDFNICINCHSPGYVLIGGKPMREPVGCGDCHKKRR